MAKINKPGEWGASNSKANKPGAWGAEKNDRLHSRNPFAPAQDETAQDQTADTAVMQEPVSDIGEQVSENSSECCKADEGQMQEYGANAAAKAVNQQTQEAVNTACENAQSEQVNQTAAYVDTAESGQYASLQNAYTAVNHTAETGNKADWQNSYDGQNQPAMQQIPKTAKKKPTAKVAIAFIIVIAAAALVAGGYFLAQYKYGETATADSGTISQSAVNGAAVETERINTPEQTAAPEPTPTPVPTPTPTPEPTPESTPDNSIHIGDNGAELVLLKESKAYTIGDVRYDITYTDAGSFGYTFTVLNNGESGKSKSIITSYYKIYALWDERGNTVFIAATMEDDVIKDLCTFNSSGRELSASCDVGAFHIKKDYVPEYSGGKLVFKGYFKFLKKLSCSLTIGLTEIYDISLPKRVTKTLGSKAFDIQAISDVNLQSGEYEELITCLSIKKGEVFTVEKFIIVKYESFLDYESAYIYIRRKADGAEFCMPMMIDDYTGELLYGWDDYEDDYEDDYGYETQFFYVDDVFKLA